MTTSDSRPLSERAASMIASAVSADAFYFRELDAVAALLREQQARIEDLEAELADRREHMRRGMQSGVNTARERGEG